MTCPHCSAEVGATDHFCKGCGGNLAAGGMGADGGAAAGSMAWDPGRMLDTEVMGARRRRVRRLGLVAVNIVLALGAGVAVYCLLHHLRGPRSGSVSLGTPRLVVLGPAPATGSADTDGGSSPAAEARAPGPRREPGTEPRVGAPGRPRPRPSATAAPRAARSPDPGQGAPAPAGDPEEPESPRPAEVETGEGAPAAAAKSVAPPGGSTSRKAQDGQDAIDRFRAGLNAESVRMVVRHHLPQVRACYDRALKQQEKIAGMVEVRFAINAQGKVGAAEVHSNTTGHAGLGKCLAMVLKRWRFPRPVGGDVEFIYPFVFSSGE